MPGRVDATGQRTLATLLKRAGYRTGAFVGAVVLSARFGLNRDFDVSRGHENTKTRKRIATQTRGLLRRPPASSGLPPGGLGVLI